MKAGAGYYESSDEDEEKRSDELRMELKKEIRKGREDLFLTSSRIDGINHSLSPT
jgi:hypothetical protein